MLILLSNYSNIIEGKYLTHYELKEEQDYSSSPVRTHGQAALNISNLKLSWLHLDKMTHFGRILWFTISHSRVWLLYHSDRISISN